jgi:thiamine biosynthesis lipoprotein
MQTVMLARHAMATRFEIVLHGDNSSRLRGAGEEALAEVERLESQLSLYQPASEIARVNACAARQPVRVTPAVFRLLEHAQRLHRDTGGAFDITIAPLLRCWGFMHGSGSWPDPAAVAAARRQVGMQHVILDAENLTVQFDIEGVMLDLGAIGKGCAIDRAAETLRETGVTSALLHGGTSTVYGIGRPPEDDAWKIAIESPAQEIREGRAPASPIMKSPAREGQPPQLLATVPLQDEALSVSAVWGKSFEHDGRTYGHVLDPRTGQPASNAVLAAVALPSATETDALSTALLVTGPEGHGTIARLRPGMRTLVIGPAATNYRAETQGISLARQPQEP